ncbi:MAG: glycine--tRNA ligase, partial [Candidatus Aenigmarchaeota archaeon]|nr:glycine--tRNA ligase [Candidatus Aenigmarchaeota archaeon]
TAGFYDYGHLGTFLKIKFENLWRNYFLNLGENFYEVQPTEIMPEKVFAASGHIKNFVDPVTKCKKCNSSFRADHLIEDKTKKTAEHLSNEQLSEKIKELKIKCLRCGSELGEVSYTNLMFSMKIGSNETGYLRPETAQGCYVAFKRMFDATRKKIPLGLAIIGKAFRNEISPRQGTYRLREFTQAELQIFFDPDKITECEKFDEVADYKLKIKPADKEETEKISCKDLLNKLPKFYLYHLAKVQQFYLDVLSIEEKNFRFRELNKEEKAFYNKYHFDVEIFSVKFDSFKEVAGVHYRTDHDLSNHEKVSGENLHVSIEDKKFIPHVLELSFGVDRNIYSTLELSYSSDILRLSPKLAPFTLGIFPLVKKDGVDTKAQELYKALKEKFDCFFDSGGSVGRRYARADEIGIPYCITVDYD